MKYFFTPSTQHLADSFPGQRGACIFKKFSDGEQYVKVIDDVTGQEVCVISSTVPPSDNFFDLFLLLDALQRLGARVNLFLTYFGYARQDKAAHGEALSAEVIARFFKTFALNTISVIHVHNPEITQFLPFINNIPYEFFYSIARNVDVIVAPDKGAFSFAQQIALHVHKPAAHVEKIRPSYEHTQIIGFTGDVKDKRALIVDDMISTGGTIVHAADLLLQQGALSVEVAATHGIFDDDAVGKIERSCIKKVHVTNTLEQKIHHAKIAVHDIAPFIAECIELLRQK